MQTALILIDLQNDFCQGGALSVPLGDTVIAVANQLQSQFENVIATQDWHPAQHASFASSHADKKPFDQIDLDGVAQTLWPDHCVQHSHGAAFHPLLNTSRIKKIVQKGTNPTVDSYSAFYDNAHLFATGLTDYLHANNITDLFMMGLATDYCVKFSALDAVKLGFNVYVIVDGCKGVNLRHGDAESALHEMRRQGVHMVHANDLLKVG